MADDIFCKIVQGDISSVKVWENEEFMAIMDINPHYEGTTLVIPKEHFPSDVLEVPDDVLEQLILSAKIVMKKLYSALNPKRVVLVIEGLGVNHLHVKLYPLMNTEEGGTTTILGPEKSLEELEEVAKKIREV